jgi:hypothetical protein
VPPKSPLTIALPAPVIVTFIVENTSASTPSFCASSFADGPAL